MYLECNEIVFGGLVENMMRVIDQVGTDESEETYKQALKHCLQESGARVLVEQQNAKYFNEHLVAVGKADLVVDGCVIEMKANQRCPVEHKEQVRVQR